MPSAKRQVIFYNKKLLDSFLRIDDGIITDGYNTCNTNLALKKQLTQGIPLMLSVNVFLYSCYPYDCYFNSFIKVFPMCSVKACVFYQLPSFLQNIICVRFYWRKMVEYLLRYESDKKKINQLLRACPLFCAREPVSGYRYKMVLCSHPEYPICNCVHS